MLVGKAPETERTCFATGIHANFDADDSDLCIETGSYRIIELACSRRFCNL